METKEELKLTDRDRAAMALLVPSADSNLVNAFIEAAIYRQNMEKLLLPIIAANPKREIDIDTWVACHEQANRLVGDFYEALDEHMEGWKE